MRIHNLLLILALSLLLSTACQPAIEDVTLPVVTAPATTQPSPTPLPAVTLPASGETAPPPVVPPSLDTINVDPIVVMRGLDEPVGIAHAGDGSGRLFIVEKQGAIRVIQDGALVVSPFLNITDRVRSSGYEQGLLGLAFDPDYHTNGYFFVNYTNLSGDTVISRFSVTDRPNQADPSTETLVLTFDQPAANHNGGNLVFGPDGYLYIGTGDGGGAADIFENGQNRSALLGKMLRIDVSVLPYTIPPDNPFLSDPATLDEIWAIGMRNPWRYSFDRLTGDLYVADVGQNVYEEIDFQPVSSTGGENYGWPIMEGMHCFPDFVACQSGGLTLPVAEYQHLAEECSVTGGYVYRGQSYPAMFGVYLFADFCTGDFWGLVRDGNGQWTMAHLMDTNLRPSSFGEDEAGEVYVVDMAGGVLYQLITR